MVKYCLKYGKTRVRSLGQEDPLEKEMATHSSILAWEIPWMEEPGRLQSMWSQRIRHDCETSLSFPLRACRGASPSPPPRLTSGPSARLHTPTPHHPTHHHHALQEAKRECPGPLVCNWMPPVGGNGVERLGCVIPALASTPEGRTSPATERERRREAAGDTCRKLIKNIPTFLLEKTS